MKSYSKSAVMACAILLTSCNWYPQESPIAVNYETIQIKTDSVTLSESYSATIQGRQDVDIYPQVSGKISRLCIKEGEAVRQGQVLFVIDQVPYQAALRTTIANRNAAEAQVRTAELDYKSKQVLFNEKVISEYDLSVAGNAVAIAQAQLEQAKAAEINARNDLSYTEVKSPVNGVVGTLPYRAGALVTPSISAPLTTVSDNSEMYVYFSMTENQLRSLINQYGSPDETIRHMPTVQLRLNDGSIYSQTGCIETISGIINPQTGTASLRSLFPNEKRLLFSGSAGSIILPYALSHAIIVPQTATYEIQDKVYVYKVENGIAVSTEIKVERIHDGKSYVVRSGLTEGDVIVSKGVGTLKDGANLTINK